MKYLSRVLRGGTWYTYRANCHAVFRFSRGPDYRSVGNGFRLVGVEDGVS